MHFFIRHLRTTATLITLTMGAADAGAQTPVKQSPFLPPVLETAPGKVATEYELAGMSVAGKATLLSITRVRDKRSSWVPVGQTVGDITAVSYDPKTDQATIRVDGKLLTLSMRKSVVVSAPVSKSVPAATNAKPVTLPSVAIPPLPANAQEEKETEARMLVTDLLEIGQEQRRAYEEAQRQAAEKAAKSTGAAKAGASNR